MEGRPFRVGVPPGAVLEPASAKALGVGPPMFKRAFASRFRFSFVLFRDIIKDKSINQSFFSITNSLEKFNFHVFIVFKGETFGFADIISRIEKFDFLSIWNDIVFFNTE